MIEDYILPQPLPEKLKLRFSRNTLRTGEYSSFEGFIISIPNGELLKSALWRKLSPILGNFSVKGITPFPSQNFPVLPIIVPAWMNIKNTTGTVEGRIHDLSQFSNMYGRFLIVEKFNLIKLEDYLLREKPSIDGRKIYNIFDSSFPETSRDIMLSFFISSGKYITRIGGCTVTLLNALSKHYASNFKELKNTISNIHPFLTQSSMKITLLYDDPLDIKIKSSMKIKYDSIPPKKAQRFYQLRNGKEWEKSAMTDSTIKIETLIGAAELPFIPYPEETQVDDAELSEFAVDIATYALYKHIEKPEISENTIDQFKERMLRKIDSEFPELSEAMKMGIVMDIANVNGFGEHIGRVIDSWSRIGFQNPLEKTLDIYLTLFERIDDVLGPRLRKEISALSEKKRLERILNRILWELNMLRPDGWSFFYFQKKLEERDITQNPEKILEELINKGLVIRKGRNLFKAIEKL